MMSELLQRLQSNLGDTYRVERELGGGGMSRVFLAEEIELGRQVVIKVLPPEMAAGVNKERFQREIKLAASLQHPHVVPLLSAGEVGGDILYYVMPFIEGESLRAKLAREGELPVDETLRILREVVDALSYAHQHGVVHRDIKPDNVMLTGHHAVVTDFGVAKAVSASSGGTHSSLTSLGVALGTPSYMSPEQAAADPHVDHRADIYAVGALAYEMLTGRPPFVKQTPQQILAAQVSETPVPVTAHRESVAPPLNDLVMRCLAKRAADRWQTADELRRQFEAMTTPQSGGVTPTGTQPVEAVATGAVLSNHPVRVAALFGVSAAVTLVVVYVLMIALGLPDWVFVGAIALLAIGSPIILVTGKHERQRAVQATTGFHVTTPVGLQQHFTWRKAITGGGMAFAGLVVVTGGYMAMRNLGIGPFGTLVARGAIEEQGELIVAEFEDRTPDGGLAEVVTEALRIDLSQSPIVRLMPAASLADALTRMNRDASTPLTAELASEIAAREGAQAVLTGEVGTLGSSYVISARLLAADGEVLVALRETAADDGTLIAAVDELSSNLRERLGESFKSLRASEPLDRVTTASLEALRLYTRANDANRLGNQDEAVQLLEQAIAADTLFAMAYRKLAVVLANTNREQSQIQAAVTRSYELRDRLPPVERYLTTAYYHGALSVDPDPDRAIAAYRSLLELDPENGTALNNLAREYLFLGEWLEASEIYGRAVAAHNAFQSHEGLVATLFNGGQVEGARAALAAYEAAQPDNRETIIFRMRFHAALSEYDEAERQLARHAELGEPSRLWSYRLAEVRGKVGVAERVAQDAFQDAVRQGDTLQMLEWAYLPAHFALRYRGTAESALHTLDSLLDRYPLSLLPPEDRPYRDVAGLLAQMDEPGRVRQLRDERFAARRTSTAGRLSFDGLVAMSEQRYADAADDLRAASDLGSLGLWLFLAGQAFDAGGVADSARVYYERAVTDARAFSLGWYYSELGPTYRRLGELYEEAGDRDKAVEFYNQFVELWADADAELQPFVEDVRGRIARLMAEGG